MNAVRTELERAGIRVARGMGIPATHMFARQAGTALLLHAEAPWRPLSRKQGKRLAQGCGVVRPRWVCCGGLVGWYGTSTTGHLVCVTTAPAEVAPC